nr:MAG TPA: Tail tape measure [Caudoviricetes sp.]
MADIKKIGVEIVAEVGDAVSAIKKFSTAVKETQKTKVDNRNAEAVKNVGNAADESAGAVNKLSKSTGGLNTSLTKLKTMVAGAFAVSAVIGFGSAALQAAGKVELLRKGLAFTLGEADTKKLIQGIQGIGEASAYDTNQLIPMSRAWINMGENAEQALTRIRKLVDLGSAFGLTAEEIDRANLALSQMAAAGKINAADMMQLTNANIPAWKMLADAMGLTVAQVRDMAAKGELAEDAIAKLWDAFSNKTEGAAATLANSLTGQVSNIQEAIANSMASTGEIIRSALNVDEILSEVGDAVQAIKAHLNNINEAAKSIGLKAAIVTELNGISPATGAAANAIISSFVGIKNVVVENAGLIKGLIETILLVKGTGLAVAAVTSAFAKLTATIKALSVATKIFAAMEIGLHGVKAAVLAVTAAMNVNPIILAITLVSAALVALYHNWDEVKAIVASAMNAMRGIAADACGVVVRLLDGLSVGVVNVGNAFMDLARAVLPDWASECLSVIGDMVGKASAMLKSLADFARGVMGDIQNAIHAHETLQRYSGVNTDVNVVPGSDPNKDFIMPERPSPKALTKPARSIGGGLKTAGGRSAVNEELKAVEALVKKYADAAKQKANLVKSAMELAKVNVSMLTSEARETEEQRIKLEALKIAHEEVLDGYRSELAVAKKIGDTTARERTIGAIQKQIKAENQLYAARARSTDFEFNLNQNQESTQTLLDKVLGDPKSAAAKIKEITKNLEQDLNDLDIIQSLDTGEQLTGLAGLLSMSPEALSEELALKNQSITDFIAQRKIDLAEMAKVQSDQAKATESWGNVTVRYATMVGDAMGEAMSDFITGAKSGKAALADFVAGLLKTAAQLLTRWLSLFAIFSVVGDPTLAARNASAAVFGAYDGKVNLKKAQGGFIAGPGTGTSDSIPAMLSNGEYVVRAAAVRKIGVPTLNALNRGRTHFAEGGYVGKEPAATSVSAGNNITLQVSALDAASFASYLRGAGGRVLKQFLFDNGREFATESEVW